MKEATQAKGGKTPFAKDTGDMTQEAQENAAKAGLYEEEAGIGFEAGKHGIKDFKIPFLTILQQMSPQCTQTDAKYVESSIPGQIVNTVTNRIFEARHAKASCITVVAVDRITEYIEWKPNRGGLVAVHLDEAILKQTKKGTGDDSNKDILPNGNIIDTTSKWFVMQETENGWEPAIIAMARTALKVSRAWLTNINAQKGRRANGEIYPMPMYAYRWKLSTVPETKPKGTFFNWQTAIGELIHDPEARKTIKTIHTSVISGQLALPSSSEEENVIKENF